MVKSLLASGCVLVIRRKPPKEHYTVITGLFILPKEKEEFPRTFVKIIGPVVYQG